MSEDFTSASDNECRIGGYVLLGTLGKGSFAKVMLARHIVTGTKVAVKIVNRQGSSLGVQELQCLQNLNHPNITRLFEVIATEDHYFFFMEHLSGGELFEYLENYGARTEEEARTIFTQLVSALHYCHQKGFVHRDLKPENILLDADHNIKLADFGLSKEFGNNKLSSFCGTVSYMAPEILRNQPYDGPKVDIWSLGVILYKVVTGRLPFDGDSFGEVKRQVLRGHFLLPDFISEECQNLLKNIITLDPAQRPTLDAIMKDPWVNRDQKEGVKLYHEPPCGDIDHHITEKMQYLGYDKEEIRESVANKTYDNIMGTYLILHSTKMNIRGHTVRVRPCSFPEQRRHHSTTPELRAAGEKTNRPTSPLTKVAVRVAVPATSMAPSTSGSARVAAPANSVASGQTVSSSSGSVRVAAPANSVASRQTVPSTRVSVRVAVSTTSMAHRVAIPSTGVEVKLAVRSASTEVEAAIPTSNGPVELAVPSTSKQGDMANTTTKVQMELTVPSVSTQAEVAITTTSLEPRVDGSTTSGELKGAIKAESVKSRTLFCPESRAATLSPSFHHSSLGSFNTASSALHNGSSGSLTTLGSTKSSTRSTRSTRSTSRSSSTSRQGSSPHRGEGRQQGPRRVLHFFLKVFCCRPSSSMHKNQKKKTKVHPRLAIKFWRVKIGPQ